MQHTTVFDTHAAVKRLTAAGVAEPQAEAIVATCGEAATARLDALATKTDLAELRADFAELRADLKTEIVYTRFYSVGAVALVAAIVKALDFLF